MTPVPPPDSVTDQGIAWHNGHPLREQRQLAAGTAAVDLSNRGVLTVTGPDRLTWLHSLTTQHLLDLEGSALALILSPNGHVEHELHLIDDGETTWIIVQPGCLDPLHAYLDSMRFMLRVEVADRSAEFAVVVEPASTTAPLAWRVPEPFASRGCSVAEVIVPRTEVESRLAMYPDRAGSWALEALRAAALMPRVGCDTDHRTIPNEMGWLTSAVHLNKGCYRGQEAVAKINNLGQPPRRFVLLHLDGSTDEIPAHGTPVTYEGRDVGWIGTAAQHFELGPIATAVLKRTTPTDQPLVLEVNGMPVHAHVDAVAW